MLLFYINVHTLFSFHFTRMYFTYSSSYWKNCKSNVRCGCIFLTKKYAYLFSNRASVRSLCLNCKSPPPVCDTRNALQLLERTEIRRQAMLIMNLGKRLFIFSDSYVVWRGNNFSHVYKQEETILCTKKNCFVLIIVRTVYLHTRSTAINCCLTSVFPVCKILFSFCEAKIFSLFAIGSFSPLKALAASAVGFSVMFARCWH